jgi:hypothetical protein
MPDELIFAVGTGAGDAAAGNHTHSGAYASLAGPWLRTGALAENMPRNLVGPNACILTSGTLHLTSIYLPAGITVTSISAFAPVGATTPTNQWFALFNSARLCLATSADDTTTAWAANAFKTLAMGTPYPVTAAGLYYVGIMVAAATACTLAGIASNTTQGVAQAAPALNGRSTTGQTGPPTPGSFTAAALSGNAGTPWVDVA